MKTLGLLALALALASCSNEPRVAGPATEPFGARTTQIYVVSHGWHTGVVVPASKLNLALPDLGTRFGAPRFYEIGWGDKGFYQAQEITTGLTLRALFWSSGAVAHISAVPESPAASFPESEVRALCVSEAQLEALEQFIVGSLVHDGSGRLVPLARGIYGESQFYDAVGRYSVLNTCNKWTAKALRSAGFDVAPAVKLTAGSISGYLRRSGIAEFCAAGN